MESVLVNASIVNLLKVFYEKVVYLPFTDYPPPFEMNQFY
jgi:hypothetical protein